MKDINLIDSERLKATKRRLGMTDGEIAAAVKTARQTVSALMNGKQGRLAVLVRICQVWRMDYRDFLKPALLEENQ